MAEREGRDGLAGEVGRGPVEPHEGVAFRGAFVLHEELVAALPEADRLSRGAAEVVALGLEGGLVGDADLERAVAGGAELAVGREVDADEALPDGLEGSGGEERRGRGPVRHMEGRQADVAGVLDPRGLQVERQAEEDLILGVREGRRRRAVLRGGEDEPEQRREEDSHE